MDIARIAPNQEPESEIGLIVILLSNQCNICMLNRDDEIWLCCKTNDITDFSMFQGYQCLPNGACGKV